MLIFLALFLCAGACIDCEDQQNFACNVEDPATNLPWLAEKIEELEASSTGNFEYVTKGRYGALTIFIMKNCCPNCLSIYLVYNCNGEEIGYLGDGSIDPDAVTNEEVVWKHEDSPCNV